MAQSQTPPNTMIVVNSLLLKKKRKNTFFFSHYLKYWLHFLHYFSSHVCAVVFITIFVASTPHMKAEAECLPSILVNEPKEEWRGDGFEAGRVCVCARARKDRCVFVTQCPLQSVRLFPCFHIQPARDYLSLIASLSSLFAPVPPPPISLSLTLFCTAFVFSPFW